MSCSSNAADIFMSSFSLSSSVIYSSLKQSLKYVDCIIAEFSLRTKIVFVEYKQMKNDACNTAKSCNRREKKRTKENKLKRLSLSFLIVSWPRCKLHTIVGLLQLEL